MIDKIIAETSAETISNAEVTDCDKNVLCRQRHERVAIMYRCGASVHSGDALTSLAESFFYFFEIKEREKNIVQRLTF